jgi:hypothetical protein
MAAAARSVDREMGVVTIEMKTTFMQAARGKLSAKGHLMHRTATMAFTDATIYDAQGKACAHATGTFKYVPRLPTGAKSVNPLNTISTDYRSERRQPCLRTSRSCWTTARRAKPVRPTSG